jgi:hypothetical protein
MTRVNGVFEKDFGVNMVLIKYRQCYLYQCSYRPTEVPMLIITASCKLATSVIGNANYDIGHLMSA